MFKIKFEIMLSRRHLITYSLHGLEVDETLAEGRRTCRAKELTEGWVLISDRSVRSDSFVLPIYEHPKSDFFCRDFEILGDLCSEVDESL